MDPIRATASLAPPTPHEPSDAEIQAAASRLAQLEREARALGDSPAAAPLHAAMGRVFAEALGDAKSAAVCYQNAFSLDPAHRPSLEAARRLFLTAGQIDRALALHEREEALVGAPAERAESLRAQAALLLAKHAGADEAVRRLRRALELAPDHPGILLSAVEASERAGEKLEAVKLLLRAAAAVDPGVPLLRRAALLAEGLAAEPSAAPEASALLAEALQKLHEAAPGDPVAVLGLVGRARASDDWEAILELSRERAARTSSPADRALCIQILAHQLGRAAEALADVKAALAEHPADGALLALRTSLAEACRAPDLVDALRARAEASADPSERADLKILAAARIENPVEQERLLSEALADNPGDLAASALHSRLAASRDPKAAAERLVALGQALEAHAPAQAAGYFLEAAVWIERAGDRGAAAQLGRRALALGQSGPATDAALRLLLRTLPLSGGAAELVALLEEGARQRSGSAAAELFLRAAALAEAPVSRADAAQAKALELAQRAAGAAQGARALELWTALALRAGDLRSLSAALERRAEAAQGAEACALFVEAAELARAERDDARAMQLFRRARTADPAAQPARQGLLAMPSLPPAERVELLAEEARAADAGRAVALHAERAALLDAQGRWDDAVQDCARALSLGGADLAVLRRLARVQLRRADYSAAPAVLVQIAQSVPEGPRRAEAYARAAELAEWKLGDPARAAELYAAAAAADTNATSALSNLARLESWLGRYSEAAASFQELADRSQHRGERTEALRSAASLRAHHAGEPAKAALLYRRLLAEAPEDLDAAAALLSLIGEDSGPDGRRARAELRALLESRCRDPRAAAMLRAESAEDRLASGDREQALADARRALSLNPHDRVVLDVVEEALRANRQKAQLAQHLAERAAHADEGSRAALTLERAELLSEDGAPPSDAGRAVGDLVEAALLAERLPRPDEAQLLCATLDQDPGDEKAAAKLRAIWGEAAAAQLVALYEKAGERHRQAAAAAAWSRAARIRLYELNDAAGAFAATGQALAQAGDEALALELRAAAAAALGQDSALADALTRRLALPIEEPARREMRLRLGVLHLDKLDDAARALPLLRDRLDDLPPETVAKVARALRPIDAIAAHRALLSRTPPEIDSLHALVALFRAEGHADRAFCAAAALVGLGLAVPEEAALHHEVARHPLPTELPQLPPRDRLRAADDAGPSRELLAAAAPELSRALPTDLSGRADRVKGDNPVRRICVAISKALGLPEPALFAARKEPGAVQPTATEPPGVLVGSEVPRRNPPRQQRFLYARALAHVRNGTHALAGLSPERLGQLVAELVRLAAGSSAAPAWLPPADPQLAAALDKAVGPNARARLAPLAAKVAAEPPPSWRTLALALRESAERVALVVCGDPAAALSVVRAETGGDARAPEVARLVRFSVSDEYFALR